MSFSALTPAEAPQELTIEGSSGALPKELMSPNSVVSSDLPSIRALQEIGSTDCVGLNGLNLEDPLSTAKTIFPFFGRRLSAKPEPWDSAMSTLASQTVKQDGSVPGISSGVTNCVSKMPANLLPRLFAR